MASYTLKQTEIPLFDGYDVIVAGGGPSGCAAAIAAARRGAETLLIESTGSLGGMSTMGLVPAWCPFTDKEKIIYRGIAEEIFKESFKGVPHARKDCYDWVEINPEYLKTLYDSKVTEAGVHVLFNTSLCRVDADNGEVEAVIVSNKAGLSAFKARLYIDCTGDGDLAFMAGAEVIPPDSEGGYQPASHCFQISNVNMKAYMEGERLHPSNPNSEIHKILADGKYSIPDTHLCNNQVYKATVGFNAGHIWDVDNTDPESLSRALMEGRRLAHEIHRALTEYRPETFKDSCLSLTAPLLGVRESRRILGDYILTARDYIERRSFPDEISRNCYYLDVHHSKDESRLAMAGKSDFKARESRYGRGESHGIPYRCLTPRGLRNVLVAGRSISSDRAVNGSIRVMPNCLCTGEAAGKAAALALGMKEPDVHKIDVEELRRQIKEDGGYIL